MGTHNERTGGNTMSEKTVEILDKIAENYGSIWKVGKFLEWELDTLFCSGLHPDRYREVVILGLAQLHKEEHERQMSLHGSFRQDTPP